MLCPTIFANCSGQASKERFGLNEASKWKIWQSGTSFSAFDTKIERGAGDSQMDVEDGPAAVLEKVVEQTMDKDNWIDCACSVKPARCFRKNGCTQGIAKAPDTMAMVTHRIISGHWNGRSEFSETIHGEFGCAPRPAQGQVVQRP